MKKLCMILTALATFLLLFCIPLTAAADSTTDLPDDVKEYVETNAYPFLAGYLPEGETYSMGAVIDLGKDPRRDDVPEQSHWEFFINDSTGAPAYIFEVNRRESGKPYFQGPWRAKGLVEAVAVMKRIMKAESCPENIWIRSFDSFGYYVYGTFGETIRVITTGNDGLDESYYAVRSSSELPTPEDVLEAMRKRQEEWDELSKAQNGAALYGDGIVKLKANPGAAVGESVTEAENTPNWLIPLLTGAAALLLTASALIITKKVTGKRSAA